MNYETNKLTHISVTILMSPEELWKAINISGEDVAHLIGQMPFLRMSGDQERYTIATSSAAQGVHVLLSLLPGPPHRLTSTAFDDKTPF